MLEPLLQKMEEEGEEEEEAVHPFFRRIDKMWMVGSH